MANQPTPSTAKKPDRQGDNVDTIDSGFGQPKAGDTNPNIISILNPALSGSELGWLAHYRVLKVLGRGGMGAVFQAEDTHLQRTVALKVILPEFATSDLARDRFLREARACAALRNDHIVTIYQVGQDRDVPYLAMEYLEGESLETRLQRTSRLPVNEVMRIGREIAIGLAAAHAHGLIHRDIKPGNIWLEAPTGRVKLLDFGLARAAGGRSNLTRTGGVVGTPEFMSPEQARGQELDFRSDLYSFGAVLYALCSGQAPFHGDSVMAVLTALAVDTPKPLHELNPEVPAPLADLIMQLLEKDPAKRPANAAEVRLALEQMGAHSLHPDVHSIRTWTPPRSPRRSNAWLVGGGIMLAVLMLATAGWLALRPAAVVPGPSGPALKVGILHSRTGTMAISERPVIDAVLLACEDINAHGGVLGRQIEPIIADGQSDEATFARQAEKLIREDQVATIFGCWTSASRKAVVPVVERHDHLLFYPVQYEGVEDSPNVVYLGPVPNQQILPALRWLVGFEGKRRWFLVGSDYVFPATANAVIREEARARGAEIVGEEYLPLGSTEVTDVVKKIAAAKPDLIVNTINGDTNVVFFRTLRRSGLSAKSVPAVSFSISEAELGSLGPRETEGDYVATNYLQSLDNQANRLFLDRFGKRYGPERVVSAAMATAYSGVYVWAKAVRDAKTDDVKALRKAVLGQTDDAPQGHIRIEPKTHHTAQFARVGRLNAEGQLIEVFASPQPVEPEPYPSFQSRAQWNDFLDGLHKRWGGRWSGAVQ
jgi:urea transport system substrate-binding protein